jgi:hypothetical protein
VNASGFGTGQLGSWSAGCCPCTPGDAAGALGARGQPATTAAIQHCEGNGGASDSATRFPFTSGLPERGAPRPTETNVAGRSAPGGAAPRESLPGPVTGPAANGSGAGGDAGLISANRFVGRALVVRLRAEGRGRGADAGGRGGRGGGHLGPDGGYLDPPPSRGSTPWSTSPAGDRRGALDLAQEAGDSREPGAARGAAARSRRPRARRRCWSAPRGSAYGSRGDEVLTEPPGGVEVPGRGLPHLEDATSPATGRIRVVTPHRDGAQGRRWGARPHAAAVGAGGGGPLGSGRQWWAGSAATTWLGIVRAIDDPGLRGPVNATSPQAVTNRNSPRPWPACSTDRRSCRRRLRPPPRPRQYRRRAAARVDQVRPRSRAGRLVFGDAPSSRCCAALAR